MASTQPNPAAAPSKVSIFESLATNPQRVQVILFALNIVLACIPLILLFSARGWATSPKYVVVVSAFLELFVLVVTLIYVAPNESSTLRGADRLRVLTLVIATLIGAAAALLGLGLPWTDRMQPVFATGMAGYRSHKSYLLLCGSLLIGGLILMFLGVQLARGFERTRSDLRRVLYGYNTFLSVFLLLIVLVLINFLAYSGVKPFNWFDKTNDWTSTKLYTLKDGSRDYLTKLDQPVKVFVIVPQEIIRNEVSTLLDNCRNITDKISWQFVSRDRDSATLIELQEKYFFREADGLLVVYGTGKTEVSEFIKTTSLLAGAGASSFQFKGEGVLMRTIEFLASGKAKAKIYFTQGQGELNIRSQPGQDSESDENMSELWERLGRGNYDLQELKFSPTVASVPNDASAVVIVRPSKPFSPQALAALREYMRDSKEEKKKVGRLFILFDVTIQGNTWTKTGLEELVQEYNVKVNEDRVLDAVQRNPESLECITNPKSPTPMGRRYFQSLTQFLIFNLRSARSVEAMDNKQDPRFTTVPLMFAMQRGGVWVETKIAANPAKIAAEMLRNPAYRMEKIAQDADVSVAVSVTEKRSESSGPDQQPRLIVFGDASWVNDTEMNGPNGELHFDLFGGCLSWLRERPDVTTSESNQRDVFSLNVATLDRSRLYFQPLGLMVLAVIGLGGAVWVARRR